tara:strand:- start:2445 stop:2747 length:303 start_codon:yes stop_codon:yes gene_type:complete
MIKDMALGMHPKGEAISWFSSDDQQLTAEIFRTRGPLGGSIFGVEFYEDYGNDHIATIMYPDKSESFVESAAENYVQGVFRKEDVLLVYTDEVVPLKRIV